MLNIFAPPNTFATETASLSKKLVLTRKLISRNIANIVHEIPPGPSIVRLECFGVDMWVVRQASIMNRLADEKRLDRGWSHQGVREVFGHGTLFVLPHGALHADKKRELKSHLNKNTVAAMVPNISALAAATVDAIAADASQPIDMNARILGYLFPVAGRALAGVEVDLAIQTRDFQNAFERIISTASSTVRMALSGMSSFIAGYAAHDGQSAIRSLFPIGSQLIHAACSRAAQGLVYDLVRRHGLKPEAVDKNTVLAEPLLYDVSMMFAAAIFTTSNLIVSALDYYSRHPAELHALRQAIAQDFPQGVRGVTQLLNTPTTQALFPVMLQQSPVGLVVRDVLGDLPLTDENGTEYLAKKGDVVLFDMARIQQSTRRGLQARLASLPAESGLVDILDAKNNDVVTTFFNGVFQCPGRPLAVTDAALFLIEALGRLDCRFLDEPKRVRSLVHYFEGSPPMAVSPVDTTPTPTGIHALFHREIHPAPGLPPGAEPQPAAASPWPRGACPYARGAGKPLGI